MKRYLLAILLSLFAAATLPAQNPGGIAVRDMAVRRSSGMVEVGFAARVARKAAPAGTTVVYAPVITDGVNRVSLPAIVVRGRRAAVNWERHEWAAGMQASYEDGIYANNGDAVDYKASVPFQAWMHDSRIEVETVAAGCCDSHVNTSLLMAGILPAPVAAPAPVAEPVPEPEPAVVTPTIGETLAMTFPFVLPASEFDHENPMSFYDDERDNALTIYYHINEFGIDEDYADNSHTLVNLLAAIEVIRRSSDSNVERVVIIGSASPEGSAALNEMLAWNRALTIKEYILKNTGLPERAVTPYKVSADWRELRRLIEQDPLVPGRREAMEIIDSVPVYDPVSQIGRLTALRILNDGRTYRYLAEHIFPKLRTGAFIRVYFNNTP